MSASSIRILLTQVPAAQKLGVSGPGLQYKTPQGWLPLPADHVLIHKGKLDALLLSPPALPLQIKTTGSKICIEAGARKLFYDGALEFQADRTVLISDLEAYIANVVSAEMPASFPLEAKKAQAVAARSYTLASLGKHKDQTTDLCDINHCHVLSVTDGIPHAKQAADATAAEALLYVGKPLYAEYSANCGGVAAEIRTNAILRSGPDCEADGTPAFCSTSPSYTWNGRLTQKQILTGLSIKDASSIRRISIRKRDPSGRVEEMEIESDRGTTAVSGLDFRRLLGSRVVRSLLCTFSVDPATGDILLAGTGFGHGRGMCQWGARGMAMEPFNKSYKDILRHYYPGAALEKVEQMETTATPPSP